MRDSFSTFPKEDSKYTAQCLVNSLDAKYFWKYQNGDATYKKGHCDVIIWKAVPMIKIQS